MISDLTLPSTVVRRNKLNISLGYCDQILPNRVSSLGAPVEIRVEGAAELVDFLVHDARPGRVHFVKHLRANNREWEYVCFAKEGEWTMFCSVFSTALAYNPMFGDGVRRHLCSGGTRIISRNDLQQALHRQLEDNRQELEEALLMNLNLSEAMTEKNLSNGFNIGGSKSLVYLSGAGCQHVPSERARAFATFMACFHNSIAQALPLFIGTGSDLNFKQHGDLYYDLCSRLSPNYVGNPLAARRWGREAANDTTQPTAAGVIATLEAVAGHLGIGRERSILIKGLGGVGSLVCRHCVETGWRVFATEIDTSVLARVRESFGLDLTPVNEGEWGSLPEVRIFSPNSSSGSLTHENLPLLKRLGVQAVVGGENNIRAKDLDADFVFRETGILTFADFLINGGGAWIVDAEMVERSAADVQDWIQSYQVPTVIHTIELAKTLGRSPEAIFIEFMQRKVKELVA